MKSKIKLISTVVSMLLVLSIITFAVYAANSQTFTINSTIGFTTENVAGHITVLTKIDPEDDYTDEGTATFTASTTISPTFIDVGSLDFPSDSTSATTIIIRAEFYNDGTIPMYVVFNSAAPTAPSNTTRTMTTWVGDSIADAETQTPATLTAFATNSPIGTVQAGKVLVLEISYTITDIGQNVSTTNQNFVFKLAATDPNTP